MEKSEPLDSKNLQNGAEASLDVFKREIEALKTEETMNGGRTVNLFEVDVADLTLADMAMWNRMKRKRPNGRDALVAVFEEYRVQTLAAGNPSRNAFVAFLAQELTKTTGQA